MLSVSTQDALGLPSEDCGQWGLGGRQRYFGSRVVPCKGLLYALEWWTSQWGRGSL